MTYLWTAADRSMPPLASSNRTAGRSVMMHVESLRQNMSPIIDLLHMSCILNMQHIHDV